MSGVLRHQNAGSLKRCLPRVEIFENAGLSFSSGRTKTEVCRTSYIARSVRDAIVIVSLKRFRVRGQKRFEYATCGCVLFKSAGKKITVFNNIRAYVETSSYF